MKQFLRQRFTDPRSTMLASNGVAQALVFAGMAGISRWYAAETIGVWSACIALINLVWSFSQLKTDMALQQSRDAVEKKQLLFFGMASHFLFSGISIVVAHGFGLFTNASNCLLFSVLVSHGLHQMFVSWCLSVHAYRQVNQLRIANALIAYPGSLLMYYLLGEQGLLWALLVGNLLPALVLTGMGNIALPGQGQPHRSWRDLIRQHLQTMSYLSGGNFLLSLTEQGMVLLISLYYDAGQTAIFFLASRLCNLPLSLVLGPMSQYNLRHFQDLHNSGMFTSKTITGYWKKWLPIGLLFFVPLMLAGPWVFAFVFGDNWAASGYFARVLAVTALFRFLNSPTSMGYFIIGQQRVFFYFTLAFTAVFGLCIGLAQLQYPLFQVIVVNSGLQVLTMIAYGAVMLHLINRKQKNI